MTCLLGKAIPGDRSPICIIGQVLFNNKKKCQSIMNYRYNDLDLEFCLFICLSDIIIIVIITC